MFITEYEKRNLRREAVCPCAWSPEALTVAIRRFVFLSICVGVFDTKMLIVVCNVAKNLDFSKTFFYQ